MANKQPETNTGQRTRLVFLNTLAAAAARIGGLVIGLLLTPYLVNQLGVESYGLWSVLGSIVLYFGLLDFGLGATFVKYISEYAARQEWLKVRQVLTFGLFFYLLLGVIIFPFAYWASPWLLGWLKITQSLSEAAQMLFYQVYVFFFLSSALSIFGSLLTGLEKMRLVSFVQFGGQLVFVLMVVIFIGMGYGLDSLVIGVYTQLFVTSLILFVLGRREIGELFAHPWQIERSLIRTLFGFGGWMQINNFSRTINMEFDRFLIGGFVTVKHVTYYEIGNKLSLLTQSLPLTFLSALLPSASALDGLGEQSKLDKIYVQASRLLAFATFTIGGFVIASSGPLVWVWMGKAYPYVSMVIALLVVTYSINNLTGVGTTIVRATGQPHYESYYALLGTGCKLAITLSLASFYGLIGILVGTLLGSIIGSIYFLWLFHRLRNIPWWAGMGNWLWRLAIATGIAGIGLWQILQFWPETFFTSSRLMGLAFLGAWGSIYLLFLLVILRLLRFWAPEDWQTLQRLVPQRFSRLLNWQPVRYLFQQTQTT